MYNYFRQKGFLVFDNPMYFDNFFYFSFFVENMYFDF